ncbi:MAG TPA: PKD domain-containing protein, partial [Herpetosiphonaceae bacterium]
SSNDTAAGFSYAFDCGSGYGSASSSATASCATNDNGARTVKARISDKDGGVSEYIASVSIKNVAPVANFTATSPVNEGDPISLALSNPSDPSSVDTAAGFSYAFDCDDGNGYRASAGASVVCTTDDNGVRTVKAKISDKDGGVTEYTATSTINNVAPQATFTASSQVDEGQSISLALSNASDPSGADTSAGFSYAFNCGSSYGSASSSATASCATDDNGVRTVKARISDKDGGVSEYTATSTINNVAPQATFTATSPVDEGSAISLTLSNPHDPSSVDTAAGFSYAFDCGSGYGSASATATASCATNDNGVRTVKARISDKDGGVSEYIARVTINNVAPVADFSTSSPVNEGSNFTLTLSNPHDPSSVDTAAGFSYAFDCGSGYGSASSTTTVSCATNDNGTRAVKAKITDKDGGVTEYTDTVVIDNVAPTATFSATSPVNEGSNFTLTLSNPHDPSSVDTAAGFSYAFDCNDGYGYRNTNSTPAVDCSTADNGVRVVLAKITDKDGGSSEYVSQVTINNVAPSVGQIIAPLTPNSVGTPITISAPFSDPGTGDTHTAVVDWDDGSTSAGTVSHNEDDLPTIGHVQATHTYTTPGIYTLRVTVTDDDGGEGSSFFQYVVIYDPNGGFVTGGGFINSPAGAYVADPSASGRANFGFNSKYQKGATVPTGQTEFQFKAGNLNFHSASYEWLVVAGARAQYKGVGTINGSGNYGFMLTVIDGQINGGGGVDKFRIKIWDKSNADGVVYDNQMGGATDADPTMAIQGGSIVIHKGN